MDLLQIRIPALEGMTIAAAAAGAALVYPDAIWCSARAQRSAHWTFARSPCHKIMHGHGRVNAVRLIAATYTFRFFLRAWQSTVRSTLR